jgi:hypothetical protein
MSVAERSAASPIRGSVRFSTALLAATIAVAGGVVTGCGGSGGDHPVTAPSRTPSSRSAAVAQAEAMRALAAEGPLQVVHGSRSLVVASVRSGIDVHDLARRVDAAVPVAAGFWRTSWPRPVVVLVPASLAHWQALTGLQPDPDVAAVSLGASSAETSRSRSGAASTAAAGDDQRIVVDPEAYRRLSDNGRSVVLRHEVEHLVSASHTPPGMPAWLVEGTADVVGFTGSGISVPQAAEELAALVRRSGAPASLPADAAFSGGSSSVAYEEGWLACRLIDRDRGAGALRSFYDGVAEGLRGHQLPLSAAQRDTIVSSALRRAAGWTLPDFVARWRADLQHELGSAA